MQSISWFAARGLRQAKILSCIAAGALRQPQCMSRNAPGSSRALWRLMHWGGSCIVVTAVGVELPQYKSFYTVPILFSSEILDFAGLKNGSVKMKRLTMRQLSKKSSQTVESVTIVGNHCLHNSLLYW